MATDERLSDSSLQAFYCFLSEGTVSGPLVSDLDIALDQFHGQRPGLTVKFVYYNVKSP